MRLRNVGLGPALRVVVESRYGDEQHQPEITPGIIAALMPGESVRFELTVVFAQKPPQVDLDGFKVKGTYLDRPQRTEYKVIAEWESAPTMKWHDPSADE